MNEQQIKQKQQLDSLYNKVARTMTEEQQAIVHEIVKLEFELEQDCNQ